MLNLPKSVRLNRRQFVRGLLASGVALAGYTFGIEPHWIEVVERRMPIARLPRELAGCRLIQISDLHIGPIVSDEYLLRAFELVQRLEPDLLVITGDFMSYRGPQTIEQTARVMEQLRHPRLGTFGILGNHDYGERWLQSDVADSLTQRLQNVGIRMLRNELHDVGGLQIIGIDDFWGTNFAPQKALAARDSSAASLVLCHNPDAVDEPIWSDYRGWILAGHTHGGQCKPPFFAPPLIPIKNSRYAAGEVDLGDGRMLYVNRALGYLRRVRINARPEITVFTLEQDGDADRSGFGVS